MSEILKRIRRLPKNIRNPLQPYSTEQKAAGVLASLAALPQFSEDMDGLTDIIKAVKTPVAPTQPQDLGHSTQALNRTLKLLESRVHLGQLSEDTTQKYLDALRHQRELSLLRPPTLAQRIGSGIYHNPVLRGASVAVIASVPGGLIVPFESMESFLFRIGFSTAVMSIFFGIYGARKKT
ncbi:hypothetical protein A2631_01780 [Candidatus Daviesbacteria bacterium RIFCSPHIGHO2_01_FULL_44_29]|uniref:Uncharacterized protein n=1 Tax=Candidatus Daviesbacteria bacterium RIFCSPHIGHO2_02_FULL_43_12 TaxID=1797776 RepID=A0A1F5KK03_9BACT|nr:MAG: hypothetical protein A2631_01780 [Candidatus Daviesbacteria bacterium RIFCSPHIGHO2_01_FULL_44_29]OGE39026.1 MAG: hypothetical protein A3E86_00300 [Candidatus Daviesbacteria bacterium RIFCSPHIGHO2_12_FULL_47_45]OGE41130.1 MAG: hypothetical protein A3D25_01175 [Candidatus Daviesbacteria bacterium RIFCSPHIGHO2_02_FULL_43_12]OGE69329.1 MAG: hypothetical protein A3B55_02915 [Candidatus Daviesbacteria bacterium RIFCSPLOWO2_01_FULL_43_15]